MAAHSPAVQTVRLSERWEKECGMWDEWECGMWEVWECHMWASMDTYGSVTCGQVWASMGVVTCGQVWGTGQTFSVGMKRPHACAHAPRCSTSLRSSTCLSNKGEGVAYDTWQNGVRQMKRKLGSNTACDTCETVETCATCVRGFACTWSSLSSSRTLGSARPRAPSGM